MRTAIANYEIEQQWGISPDLWEWCHEANIILDAYFEANLHRYGKRKDMKEIIHQEAQTRKQQKAARQAG